MKHFKKLSAVFCGLLFLFALAGCAEGADMDNTEDVEDETVLEVEDDAPFSLSYEISQTEFQYAKGSSPCLTAYVTNVSGQTYTTAYEFAPFASVFSHEDPDYKIEVSYTLDESLSIEEADFFEIADGERGSQKFWLSMMPRGVLRGSYDIRLSFYDHNEGVSYSKTFENVITVV